MELKILSALLYFYGLSLRKASKFVSLFEKISHESARIYYHRIKKVVKHPERKKRRLIAIDEAKKLENKQIIIWSAIDVDTKECLSIWTSEGREGFEIYAFLKEVLRYCKNELEVCDLALLTTYALSNYV